MSDAHLDKVVRWAPVLGMVAAFMLVFGTYAEIGAFRGATDTAKAVAMMGGIIGLTGSFMWKVEHTKRLSAERLVEVKFDE